MIKTIKFLIQYRLVSAYNRLIFYLQKIPFLGKKIPNKIYRSKTLLALGLPLSIIYKLLSNIVTNILFVSVVGILLTVYSVKITEEEVFLFSKYGIYYISLAMILIASILEVYGAFENSNDKYLNIKILRVNPRYYSFSADIIEYVPKIIGFTIAMAIFGSVFKISSLEALSFVVFAVGLRLFLRSIYIFLFRNRYRFGERFAFILVVLSWVLVTVLGVLGSIINLPLDYGLFFNKAFLPVGLLMILFTIIFSLKTSYLEKFILKSLSMSKLMETKKIVEEANTQSAKVEEDKISISTTDFSNYKGIAYINKIFYSRIGSVFKKKIIIRLIWVFIGVIALNTLKFLPDISKKDILDASKFVPLIIILISRMIYLGEFFTRTTFYYMDSKLLKFKFYRSNKNIKDSIIFRMKQLLKYNSPTFIFLSICLLISYYNLGIFESRNVLMLILSVISGYMFMNFHFLFAYYMFQPFTNQMKVKSPFYTGIITFFNYILYFGMIKLSNYTYYLVIGFFIFVVIYVILGIYLVYLVGGKRFKLR